MVDEQFSLNRSGPYGFPLVGAVSIYGLFKSISVGSIAGCIVAVLFLAISVVMSILSWRWMLRMKREGRW